jgi:hypothetical protein
MCIICINDELYVQYDNTLNSDSLLNRLHIFPQKCKEYTQLVFIIIYLQEFKYQFLVMCQVSQTLFAFKNIRKRVL